MFLIPEFAIERWLFHDGLSVNDGRLVALAPAVEEVRPPLEKQPLAEAAIDPTPSDV